MKFCENVHKQQKCYLNQVRCFMLFRNNIGRFKCTFDNDCRISEKCKESTFRYHMENPRHLTLNV